MLEQFLNHILEHKLFKSEEKVLLAVSGGVDSMVMLNLFKEANFAFGVAHANFQLRGDESNEDEAFVKKTCDLLGIPFFSKRFTTETFAAAQGVSVQMAARELRYGWFNDLLQHYPYMWIATAHHLNDSMETALLNWTRGTGGEGLAGIPVKSGNRIRPLLFATRDRIQQYAVEHNLTWREDSSNASDDYQRNYIRHHILPKLLELNPSLVDTVAKGMKKMGEQVSLVERYIQNWSTTNVVRDEHNWRIAKQSETSPMLLWYVLKSFGFNYSQCENIHRSLNGQPGKRFVSATHHLSNDRSDLILSKSQEPWNDSVTISNGQTEVALGPFEMTIQECRNPVVTDDPQSAMLDAQKLAFPLIWRTWNPGDFFYPLGMEHSRKLSDFLIDRKVPLQEKNQITVLESGGQIAWVVGHRIDNRFKVTDSTQSAFKFSVCTF